MLALSVGTKVSLASKPVSMLNGFDGLAALTRELFDVDPSRGICSCFAARAPTILRRSTGTDRACCATYFIELA